VGRKLVTRDLKISCLSSRSPKGFETFRIVSGLRSTAIGAKKSNQTTESIAMTKVTSHALETLFLRERYVFRQTTSIGAGAALAFSCMGTGSRMACAAICYGQLALTCFHRKDIVRMLQLNLKSRMPMTLVDISSVLHL
jgi:hypothetical protein